MTPKQAALLTYIHRYQEHNDGVSPTLKECAAAVGFYDQNTVKVALVALQVRGLVKRIPGRHRHIEIIPTNEGNTGMMWGCMACITHRIGGRRSVPSEEIHTLTVSSAQPQCRICKTPMTSVEFTQNLERPGRGVRPKPNGKGEVHP